MNIQEAQARNLKVWNRRMGTSASLEDMPEALSNSVLRGPLFLAAVATIEDSELMIDVTNRIRRGVALMVAGVVSEILRDNLSIEDAMEETLGWFKTITGKSGVFLMIDHGAEIKNLSELMLSRRTDDRKRNSASITNVVLAKVKYR